MLVVEVGAGGVVVRVIVITVIVVVLLVGGIEIIIKRARQGNNSTGNNSTPNDQIKTVYVRPGAVKASGGGSVAWRVWTVQRQ